MSLFVPLTGGQVRAAARGGIVSEHVVGHERYRVHTFLNSNFFVVDSYGSFEFVLVAGGGGGGSIGSGTGAGGGGGGPPL